MKKFLVILFVILMIVIFNLINFSFEPLPDEKLQLINIVLVTIYSMIALGLSTFFCRYPKIKEIADKLLGIISLFVLVNLPLIFKITDIWALLVLLDLFLCVYYYKKYIEKQTHEEIIEEEYMAEKYLLETKRKSPIEKIAFNILIIIGYISILMDLLKNLSLFYKNKIVYFILFLINVFINLYIVLKSKRQKK